MRKEQQEHVLVMNIKRRFFADILAQPSRKRIEYRELSDYWLGRLEKVGREPFKLRLLNGMTPPVPEGNYRGDKGWTAISERASCDCTLVGYSG